MWVMHPDGGFYSAVEDKRDPNMLVVRARVRADLERLAKMVPAKVKVISNEGTDYPYRIRLTRRQWADVLVQLGERIDYTNFKDAVAARQGKERAYAYGRIWSVLFGLQPRRLRNRQRRQAWLDFDAHR